MTHRRRGRTQIVQARLYSLARREEQGGELGDAIRFADTTGAMKCEQLPEEDEYAGQGRSEGDSARLEGIEDLLEVRHLHVPG